MPRWLASLLQPVLVRFEHSVQRAIQQQLRRSEELAAAFESRLRAGGEQLGVVFQDALASIRAERDAALEAIRAERGKP